MWPAGLNCHLLPYTERFADPDPCFKERLSESRETGVMCHLGDRLKSHSKEADEEEVVSAGVALLGGITRGPWCPGP